MKKALHETVIYGGAFNPPTRAHQAILQACIDYAEPRGADVWLLPSASRHDKTIHVPRERRIALLEALVKDVMIRTVKVSIAMLELDRSGPTETYETVQALGAEHPERTFTWVFGHDSLASMPTWRGGEWLLGNLSILVAGHSDDDVPYEPPNIGRLPFDAGEIRSTEVRRRIEVGEDYSELVGEHVGRVLQI